MDEEAVKEFDMLSALLQAWLDEHGSKESVVVVTQDKIELLETVMRKQV